MAITKTRAVPIASQTVNGAATVLSSSRDLSSVVALSVQAKITYGGSIPASDPYVEVYASNNDTDFDTEPLELFFIPRATSVTKQVTIPVRFTEAIKYYKVRITNGATNSITAEVSVLETTN